MPDYDVIYLDNAATTYPKPECVYQAADEFYRCCGGNAGRDFEDIPTDTFFAALEKVDAHRPPQHVEMEGKVVGDRLVFIPPEGVPLPFTVHDNEIILGDYTIRVRLEGVQLAVLAETPDSANVNGE